MIDLFTEIAQTLRNNRTRTFLTGLAVAWGIFMLVVLLGMSNGVVNAFEKNVNDQGMNILKIWGSRTSRAWHGYKEGRFISLRSGDLERIASDSPDKVNGVTARLSSEPLTISSDHDYISTGYSGIFPALQNERRLKVSYGRFINNRDMAERRKVAVISSLVADALFPNPSEAVGQTLRIGNIVFTIVGTFESEWSREVYVPFTTAQLLMGYGDIVDEISVDLKNVHSLDDGTEAEERVRRSLAAAHDFSPEDPSAVDTWNQFNQQIQMGTGMKILHIAVWVIGLFTLVSGIIGVSNIMFVSVRERTHEIGVRRAIGAKPSAILVQILSESIAITTLSGMAGVVLGTLLTETIDHLQGDSEAFVNPGIDFSLALAVMCVLIIAGLGAGLFPALKALKIKPVEALREE